MDPDISNHAQAATSSASARFTRVDLSAAKPLFDTEGRATEALSQLFQLLGTKSFLGLLGANVKEVVTITQQLWFKEFENEFPSETCAKFGSDGNPGPEFLGVMKGLGFLTEVKSVPGREVSAAVVLGSTLAAHLLRLQWLEDNLASGNLRTTCVILNGADRKILPSETEEAFSWALRKAVTYKDLPFVIERQASEVPVGQNAASSDRILQVNEGAMMRYLIAYSGRFPHIKNLEVVVCNLSAEQLKVVGRSKPGTLEAAIPLAVKLGERFGGRTVDLEVVSSQPYVTRQGIDIAWGIVNTCPAVDLRSVHAIGAPLNVSDKNVFGVRPFLQELAKRIRAEALAKGLIEIA